MPMFEEFVSASRMKVTGAAITEEAAEVTIAVERPEGVERLITLSSEELQESVRLLAVATATLERAYDERSRIGVGADAIEVIGEPGSGFTMFSVLVRSGGRLTFSLSGEQTIALFEALTRRVSRLPVLPPGL
jgi:hypothetical protein